MSASEATGVPVWLTVLAIMAYALSVIVMGLFVADLAGGFGGFPALVVFVTAWGVYGLSTFWLILTPALNGGG